MREARLRNASRRLGLKVAATALMVAAFLTGSHAQNQPGGVAPPQGPQVYRTTGSRVAIGRSITIPRDEEVSDAVVVIGGSLRVEGRVRDGIVVVGGDVELGPQADVRGDVVLVGGTLTRADSAQLRGSVSNVNIGDWGSWSFGGFSFPSVQLGDFGRWLSLLGTVFRIALLAVVMAFMLLVARAPVARIGRSAAAEPIRAFLVGVAAAIFFVPVLVAACIALVVTIIGIPLVAIVVPGALCLAFIALMLGFTGLACHIGEWVEDRFGWRGHSALLATSIGLVLIVGPTMLARLLNLTPGPLQGLGFGLLIAGALFELVIWTIGLGAALMTGLGRWSTAPPPLPPPNAHGVIPVAS
jgi:hypothetical protein